MFLLVGEQLTGSSAVGKHICVLSFLLLVVLYLVIHIPHCSLQWKTYNSKGWNWNFLTHAASDHFTRHILHWSRLLKLDILSLQLPSFWCSHYSGTIFLFLHLTVQYLCLCFKWWSKTVASLLGCSSALVEFIDPSLSCTWERKNERKKKIISAKVHSWQIPFIWPVCDTALIKWRKKSVEFREFPRIAHPYRDSFTKTGKFFTVQESLQQSEGNKMLVGTQGVSIAVSQLIGP